MGKFLCKIGLIVSVFAVNPAFSQEVIRQQSCDISMYKQQIDSLKTLFATNGFALVREASMTMESEYEMPIILQMQQGSLYHFVFIGEPTSKLYEVRMYDWNERQVAYQKKMWGDIDGNIINFAYTPQFTEYHMIKPVQVNKQKKKGLCGYVMLVKKIK
ncbi:MAG TPA: hypothetical protein VFZ47_03220 [Chitinophagaceae bacterium]